MTEESEPCPICFALVQKKPGEEQLMFGITLGQIEPKLRKIADRCCATHARMLVAHLDRIDAALGKLADVPSRSAALTRRVRRVGETLDDAITRLFKMAGLEVLSVSRETPLHIVILFRREPHFSWTLPVTVATEVVGDVVGASYDEKEEALYDETIVQLDTWLGTHPAPAPVGAS